jgi:molybdenum cofactor cytidylyltransferase
MNTWKPLLPFGGSTIIETVVHTALTVCSAVVLVTGHRGEELASVFESDARVRIAHNQAWKEGMLSSVLTGIRKIGAEKFFIVPGDMPYLHGAVYRSLLEAQPADVAYPEYNGRRGHPVLIDSGAIDTIYELARERETMREILRDLRYTVVPWQDDTIHRDIDTPVDYDQTGSGGTG